MAETRRRSRLAVVLSVAAVVFIVGALWPRSDGPPSDAERADQIASRIRCPFCNGESIADATSQVARDLEVVIREQVAAGMSDDEIFDFFAARYGESLLLDPPLLGWGWALWVLPLLGVAVGVAAVIRRRRRAMPAAAPPHDGLEAAGLRERLDAVARDRAEVGEQMAAGELDAETTRVLTATLDDEAASITDALAVAATADDDDETPLRPTRRFDRRIVSGAAFLLIGAVAVGATLVLTSDEGGDGGIVDAPPIDPASITTDRLEEVVAANPDVVPMRLMLAKMLMDEGEVLRAAQHFNEVLQREDNPEALAWLGWISFLVDENEAAEQYLLEALEIAPDYPQAQWWLANVRLIGLSDPAGAIAPLEAVLAADGVPEDVRATAAEMLDQARAQL